MAAPTPTIRSATTASTPSTLQEGLHYAVPQELLFLILQQIQAKRFNAETLIKERKLTDLAHEGAIGCWNGRAIRSSWISPPPQLAAIGREGIEFLQQQMGATGDFKEALVSVDGELQSMRLPSVAFLGWLLTDRTFLQEHDELLRRHDELIRKCGLPFVGAISRSLAESRFRLELSEADRDTNDALKEFELFYIRWRLQGLDGPYAPNPLTPQLPVSHLPGVLGHMSEGGQVFYLPDTYPVPSRDELRRMIEDSLRPSCDLPEHLRDWILRINAQQTAKNQLVKFARIFPLQHFVRQMYSRHGEALIKSKSKMYQALGDYFQVSLDTVKDDFSLIADRLGSGWEEEKRAF